MKNNKLEQLEPKVNVPDDIAEKVKITIKTQRSLANVIDVLLGNLSKTIGVLLGSKKENKR
jgi:hypothetical protein